MSLGTRIASELKGDRAIWAIVAILALFSILVVYSSTGTLAYKKMGGNTEAYLMKHVVVVAGGLMLTYMAHLIHYTKYSRWAPTLLVVSIPLLVFTIAFGPEINDARRWIEVPFVGVTIQTSDFAKLALLIYVARAISSKQEYIKDFNSAFLPIIVPVLIICGLIAPANLSTAALLFITCMGVMFVGRVAMQYILLLLLLGVVVFATLVLAGEFFPDVIRSATWTDRVREFMEEPDGVDQVQQAKIAIANGGWLGLGPGNSIQRNYLYSSHSDFIYAIVIEEYGILAGILIVLLYLFLFFRATRLVTKSPKAFGAMLVMGLTFNMILQAFVNIAVSVHLVPVTGVTLPMISMGGTSMLFTCVYFGIILSVSKYIEAVSVEAEAT
ncbi:MAG TPA: FtsW/RodA/SpoVE family cell cycle protein [Saprospiraceae bacterium]|nr:FtsW/RodA/SpoVE family cell cycle protein [Saprospiraceae bacterium]HMQ81793.1 FtsW/RodA/SpoVE family cell cycle protein [Saprospiraceae bacterium]